MTTPDEGLIPTMSQNTHDDLAAALAALPPDVRAGLMTLTLDEQRAYLRSLDRIADMEAKGATFVPDMQSPDAPYGLKKDGTPKRRPGRPPAANPGARTKERPERVMREIDLEEILADLPEVDEEITFTNYPDRLNEPAPAVSAAELEAAEKAAYEAELAQALERAGKTSSGREVVTREFTGQRRVDPEDPDDPLAVATIEELRYRVTADDTQWYLEQLVGNTWSAVSSGYDLTGLALHWAVNRVVVSNFGDLIVGLPRLRPARERYVETMWTTERPKSVEEREKVRSDMRSEMRRQRGARPDQGSYNWI
jgi:hypothetical protein